MSEETKQILIKRLKSLVWRLGGMIAAVVLNWVAANLSLFNLNAEVVVVLGLVIGELTKYLNTKNSEA